MYPKDRPNREQVTVVLEATSLGADPIGFLVSRHLLRPTEKPDQFVLESAFHENFYENREILQAIKDYETDVLPELTPQPFEHYKPRPWDQVPRLTSEKKAIPQEKVESKTKAKPQVGGKIPPKNINSGEPDK